MQALPQRWHEREKGTKPENHSRSASPVCLRCDDKSLRVHPTQGGSQGAMEAPCAHFEARADQVWVVFITLTGVNRPWSYCQASLSYVLLQQRNHPVRQRRHVGVRAVNRADAPAQFKLSGPQVERAHTCQHVERLGAADTQQLRAAQ